MPDGRHFLFFLQAAGIHLGALDSDDLSKLTPADSHGVYLPPTATGHINVQQNGASILNAWRGLHRPVNGSGEGGWLLWVKDGTLVAQQFDLARGVLTGDRLTLARSVAFDPVRGASAVSVSATGLVAYRTGSASRGTLMWTDRSGKVLETLGPILPNDTNIRAPSLSPDGRRVVVYRGALNNQGIWLLDGSRLSRFTLNGVQARFPVWSPDGKQIVFDKIRGGASDLYLKPAGGAEPEVLLVGSTPKNNLALDWSPDGRFILYESLNGEASSDLWVVPVAGSRTPQVLFSAPFDQLDGRFSQDGRWVAYASNESGRSEIYIRPFVPPTRQVRADSHGMQWQVSTDGGITPAWSHDGKELYFIAPDGTMMAAPISAHGSTVRAGVPLALFPTRIMYGGGNAGMGRQYDIARDGRFLINAVVDDAASHITLIQNWMPASTQ